MRTVKMSWTVRVLLVLGVIGTYCSIPSGVASVDEETNRAASQLGAKGAAEISFEKGSFRLSKGAQKELSQFIGNAKKRGAIKHVKVAAWADQEYPSQGTEPASSQVDLAEKRAQSIEKFLNKYSNLNDVKVINMAKRPNLIQESFKTDDARVKETLETAGAAPTHENQTGLFGLKGKAAHAVLMIFM